MKFCIVVGTRPQIIKSQPIIKEITARKQKLTIIHTGQHYDYEMSKSFFEEMKIKDPDINLEITPQSPIKQLVQIISKLEKPLSDIRPDLILVPGDTTSALATTLCANKLGFKIAHVESGARTNQLETDEEVNRRIIDHSSDFLFAPTLNCYNNLKKECVLGMSYFTGDTMLDVFLEYTKKLSIKKAVEENFVLMTIHRRENIENYQKIKEILNLAKRISKSGKDVIFPIHPHTKKQIQKFGISLGKIHVIEPVKYSEMLRMLSKSSLVITDSGGLQKEAYWMNTHCATMRKNTEWLETLSHGHNRLLSSIKKTDLTKIMHMMKKKSKVRSSTTRQFGNGQAAKKIVSLII